MGIHNHDADIARVDPVHLVKQVLLELHVEVGAHRIGTAVEGDLDRLRFHVDQAGFPQQDVYVGLFNQPGVVLFHRRRCCRDGLGYFGEVFFLFLDAFIAAGEKTDADERQRKRHQPGSQPVPPFPLEPPG